MMPDLPADTPDDFRAKVWEQMYEGLFKSPLFLPTAQEMADDLASPRWRPLAPEIIVEPKPSGWVWEQWKFANSDRFAAGGNGQVVWFGIDYAKGCQPIWEQSEDDRAVHRAIVAMHRPTRAHEL